MKKKIIALAILPITIISAITLNSCDKDEIEAAEVKNTVVTTEEELNQRAPWPPINVDVDITFEPIRLARATTDRNRDHKDCGCNECFGVCNRPLIKNPGGSGYLEGAIGVKLGIEQLTDDEVMLYMIGDEYPSNFEEEFGIDEPVVLLGEAGSYTLKTGVYQAIAEQGTKNIGTGSKSYNYSGKVLVKLAD
ncbi:MAG: hypothetical protein N4A41_13450 [Crocinitomicaceae bacterium]|jgi:hypothetical protein|nr:hypothetical protein [Crocinitomicaceae bacterium]